VHALLVGSESMAGRLPASVLVEEQARFGYVDSSCIATWPLAYDLQAAAALATKRWTITYASAIDRGSCGQQWDHLLTSG
jgi:hypothetical protein